MDVATNNEYMYAYHCLQSLQGVLSLEDFARLVQAYAAMDERGRESNLKMMEQDARLYPAAPGG